MVHCLFVSLSHRLEGVATAEDFHFILPVKSPLIVYYSNRKYSTSIPCIHGYICVQSYSADKLIKICRRLISRSACVKSKLSDNSIIFNFVYEK